MTELLQAITSWRSLLFVVVVFGFAPGFILRLLVKVYPRDDPRRQELVAELYTKGRIERLFFVAEQLETVLIEGVPHRVRSTSRWVRPHTKRLWVWLMNGGYWPITLVFGTVVVTIEFIIYGNVDPIILIAPSALFFATLLQITQKLMARRSKR